MKCIPITEAKQLWNETASFWLRNVKQVDEQTVQDVLALLDWPEKRKILHWAKDYGRSQVFTAAIMEAGVTLAALEVQRSQP